MPTVLLRATAPLAAALLLALPVAAAASDCASAATPCSENPRFSATVTDFRVLQTGTQWRPLSVTVRLRNKTAVPLTLVYVEGSAAAVDDRGHRYTMRNSRSDLRGLGAATAREFDPRFTLAAGETADARLEVSAHISGVYGTVFDLDFAVREVESLPGNQHRLGRETVLRYTGLRDGLRGTAPAAAAAAPAAAPEPSSAAPAADPAAPASQPAQAAVDACAGAPNCLVNGPLLARVQRMAPEAVTGGWHAVVVTVSFRNLSAAPMILTYKQNTGEMLDNLGQRYKVDWRYREHVQGIPVSTRDSASSQFTLAPGQSRSAVFRYTRHVAKTQVGTRFSPALAVEQYELLPSNQLRLLREYALDFGAVAPGGSAAAAGEDLQRALQTLGNIFKK